MISARLSFDASLGAVEAPQGAEDAGRDDPDSDITHRARLHWSSDCALPVGTPVLPGADGHVVAHDNRVADGQVGVSGPGNLVTSYQVGGYSNDAQMGHAVVPDSSRTTMGAGGGSFCPLPCPARRLGSGRHNQQCSNPQHRTAERDPLRCLHWSCCARRGRLSRGILRRAADRSSGIAGSDQPFQVFPLWWCGILCFALVSAFCVPRDGRRVGRSEPI